MLSRLRSSDIGFLRGRRRRSLQPRASELLPPVEAPVVAGVVWWVALVAALVLWAAASAASSVSLGRDWPAAVALAALVGLAYVGTGAMLLRNPRGAVTGWYLLTVGAIWPAGPCVVVTTGYYAVAGYGVSVCVWTLLVIAVLSYPADVPRRAVERRFLVATGLIVTGVGVLIALLSEPEWNGVSTERWPTLVASRPLFDVIAGIYPVACVGIAIGVFVLLRQRLRLASGVDRRALIPALIGAAAAGLIAALSTAVQVYLASADAWIVGLNAQGLALLAVPLSIIVVALKLRRIATDVLTALPQPATPRDVERALGRALGDRSIAVYFDSGDGDGCLDSDGRPVAFGTVTEGRLVVPLRSPGERTWGWIALASSFRFNGDQLEAALHAAWIALENARLQADLRARLAELGESRARIVDAQRDERRRLAQDLHDGLQQALLGLAARATALKKGVGEGQTAVHAEALADGALAAVEQVRQVSRGLHSPVLRTDGLEAALEEVTDHLGLDVEVRMDTPVPSDRLTDVAYMWISEALTNVKKHAGTDRAWVRVQLIGADLVLSVHDDGVGAAPGGNGSLRALRERAAMVDGTIEVTSSPGCGTTVCARLPMSSSQDGREPSHAQPG